MAFRFSKPRIPSSGGEIVGTLTVVLGSKQYNPQLLTPVMNLESVLPALWEVAQ